VSAARLREAAALMRRRAEAATPGPWEGYYDDSSLPYWSVITDRTGDQVATHDLRGGYEEPHGIEGADAYHIASWHPAVALTVADWLDEMATDFEPEWARLVKGFGEDAAREFLPTRYDDAFKVANAYLGGTK
jgi:hypothetical protein